MQGKKAFRVGGLIKSFYNEGIFKIEGMRKASPKDDKFFIGMVSLSNGEKFVKCLSYAEFSDEYYPIDSVNAVKVGDKLKYKGHVNNGVFHVSKIYIFEHQEGLRDFYLKSELSGDVINFIGTEEELLQKYELQKGSVEMDKYISEYAKFKTPSPVNCTQSILINQELKRIEREGNIDRLLDKRDFKTLKKFLEE